ncbi:response regulator [Tissierella carlieri]|uniref:PAS domain-containing hybrid sensor histidine kinase/response regulator n=1 Tax=Tissierella carlieri TaxID=689904 RepID=UPI001C122C0F|nr:PAS domain-containing hybrid sensor histidine kinase/response regulator [Tissierella carlieri]MBU5312541.1 response regulator [Tissierella carlieri]
MDTKKTEKCVFKNIREMDKIEDQLHSIHPLLEYMFENATEGMCIIDDNRRIIKVNSKLLKILDVNEDKILDKKCYEINSYIICDLKECPLERMKKGEHYITYEIKKRLMDREIFLLITATRLFAIDKELRGTVLRLKDITIFKEEEKSIKKHLNLLKHTIDSIQDIIAIIKPDLTVELLNKEGYKFFDSNQNNVIGKKWNQLIEEKLGKEGVLNCQVASCKDRFIRRRYFAKIDKYMDWYSKLIFDERGNIKFIIERLVDITTSVKHEEEINQDKELNIIQNEFLTDVSHEIRTPMNGIIGLVELLGDTPLNDIQREYIDMLRFTTDRLLSLVNDILDLSKIQAGKFEPINDKFNILKLLKDITHYFKLQADKKGLDFDYKINGNMPHSIIGDVDRLSQVLFNIIGNSIKFTEKGYISLELEVCYEDDKQIDILFSVKDTGIGIPSENIDTVFESFNQVNLKVSRKYGGTGLGLAISKKLVELMGGEIKVKSQQGKGSIFSFNLKFLKDDYKSLDKQYLNSKESSTENILFYGIRILVAEDDIVNQRIIKSILDKKKCIVSIVSNGKDTLEHWQNNDVDLILMDIEMPVMNGFEIVKEIRERELITGKYTPIIALTGATMREDREKCLKMGMDGYISKPIRIDGIYQEINSVLRKYRKIESLSIRQFLERVDGDKEVLMEIIEDIISDDYEKEYLGNIETCIEQGNLEALNKNIHKFKGSISNFDAYNAINILETMDENIKSRNLYTIKHLFKELKNEFFDIKCELKEYKRKFLNNL